MGTYDTVYASCPKCGKQTEVQSNAGECRFKRYAQLSVPLEIAGALDGRSVSCKHCDHMFKLVAAIQRITLVSHPIAEDFD